MDRRELLVLLPLLVVFLSGCNESDPTLSQVTPPEIEVSNPVADTVTDFEVFTGRTQAVNSVELRARVTGYLAKAPFRQGEDVKKNEILFVIQQHSFEIALKQARATRDQQRAQLLFNEANQLRNQVLNEKHAVAMQDLQQTRSALDASKAGVEAAEAAVAIAQQNLDWTVIRAPFDGRMSRRLVDPGNDVLADGTVLASIVQLDKLYAYFDVDERTLLRINDFLPQGKAPSPGMRNLPVALGLAHEKPEEFKHEGMLDFADNKVDPSTGTLRMWGIFNNPSLALKPGLFIRVRMEVGEPRKAWFVDESTLGADQGRKYLYVVDDADKIVYTPVVVGQRKNGRIAVEKGLKGGERIVVNGLQRVRPQMSVQPKPVAMPNSGDKTPATMAGG